MSAPSAPSVLREACGRDGRYRIRLATVDDAVILAHHRAGMFRDMKEVDANSAALIENATIDHIAALIESREYFGFLAECDGEVVGGGGVWMRLVLPRPRMLQGSTEAYVLNVFTEPEHRREGVALAIMETILEWCRRRRVGRVTLHASDEGRALYEKLGFAPTNEMRVLLI